MLLGEAMVPPHRANLPGSPDIDQDHLGILHQAILEVRGMDVGDPGPGLIQDLVAGFHALDLGLHQQRQWQRQE